MKKILLLFITVLLLTLSSQAQTDKEKNSINQIKEFEPADYKDDPGIRFREFMRQRAYPYDSVPDNARQNAYRQVEQMMHDKSSAAMIQAQQPVWRAIGPFKVGGRIKTVAPHPTKDGVVFAGAAAGGIWKSTDYGNSWNPIFDFENGIAFGSIAIDPNHPDTMYAGTGEAVSSAGNGLGATPIYLGAGLFKTTDGGNTWNLIGLRNVGTFSKVYVHPKNSNFIVAGGCYKGQGFFKSTNGGSTWTKTLDKTVTDITIDPNDVNTIFAGVTGEGVYYSSDGGDTWEIRSTGLDAGIGRVSVQLAPTSPSTLYTLIDISGIGTIYKSTNSGQNWTSVYRGSSGFFNSQGWYDNYITVDPTDEKTVIAGGIDIYRTSNGGTNWANMTNGYGGGTTHVDQHCAAFDPLSPSIIYAGNDGGMYKSTNTGSTFEEINNNLQVTQFYSMAIDNSQVNRNFGGTQDNGTLGNINPDNWTGIIGGDGFKVVVDSANPNTFYGETWGGNNIMMVKVNLATGASTSMGGSVMANDTALWNAPLVMDPEYDYVLYHGRHALYTSYDNGGTWFALTSKKTYQFTAIASSPVDANVIWAGNDAGELYLAKDAGQSGDASFADVSKNGLVNRYMTDIAPSLTDAGTAYVTFSGYGSPHVFKTTDYGQTWQNIGVTLPDVPCNAIAIYPGNKNWIFVGTDVGVFATFDGGANWLPYGRGLPHSPVLDIEFHTNRLVLPNPVLRVATHGRSMWEVDIPSDAVTDQAIVSPAGGEVYVGTSSSQISWYGFTQPVKVEYSLDDGVTWHTLADNVTGNYMRWTIPNVNALLCRIRVSSSENTLVSKSFTINILQKGSVINTNSVKYIPYGIAYDGINGLWCTDFGGNKLYKLNAVTFAIEKSIPLPGDSLFSDLTYDRQNGILYIHKMNSTSGNGGYILILDTNGTTLRPSLKSPAKNYPIGLELVDGNLVVGDRDGTRQLYVINPETGNIISQTKNPYNKTYGPRGLCYDGSEYLYQVCTYFPSSSGSLTEALAMKIDKNDMGKGVDSMPLETTNSGLINARGIDIDPRDNNFWISDYNGNLYKIAGFNTIVSAGEINENPGGNIILDTKIYPNPMHEFVTISFKSYIDDAKVRVQVSDILGRNIGTYFDGILNSGESQYFQLNSGQISSGVYYVSFFVNGRLSELRQLVVTE